MCCCAEISTLCSFLNCFCLEAPFNLLLQVIALPEVKVSAINYKYLSLVDNGVLVKKQLEAITPMFDLKTFEFYELKRRTYSILGSVPYVTIRATYSKDAKLKSTKERLKDVTACT